MVLLDIAWNRDRQGFRGNGDWEGSRGNRDWEGSGWDKNRERSGWNRDREVLSLHIGIERVGAGVGRDGTGSCRLSGTGIGDNTDGVGIGKPCRLTPGTVVGRDGTCGSCRLSGTGIGSDTDGRGVGNPCRLAPGRDGVASPASGVDKHSSLTSPIASAACSGLSTSTQEITDW